MKFSSYLLIGLVVLTSCECSGSHPATGEDTRSEAQRMEENIESQRDFLEKERTAIKAYIEDRDLVMERTGTGMYFEILEDSSADIYAEAGDEVEFEYDIFLLNGSLLYTSAEREPRILKIEKEDAELGLHEALKLAGLGDKARFILPSHLAFGVGGDQNKVPPRTPLLYELKILNIYKSESE